MSVFNFNLIQVFIIYQVKRKYGNMPFNLRNFEEEAKAKMGVVECVAHKLIEPFQVLYEKHCKYEMNELYSRQGQIHFFLIFGKWCQTLCYIKI